MSHDSRKDTHEDVCMEFCSESEDKRALLESVSLSNRHKGNQQPDDRHQTSDNRLGHKATDNRHKDNRHKDSRQHKDNRQ
jgi:hypothetical protein